MLVLKLSAIDDGDPVELQLEHSLVSLSKWEAIHEKAFFNKNGMNEEETLSYIRQMLKTKNPPEDWLEQLQPSHYRAITDYINSKQTATWFREDQNAKTSTEVVTAELIYYWMINFNIPFMCENWHVNRLMTLIKVCSLKQAKPRKMSRAAQMEEYRRLNAQRKAQLGSTG
jgi:hypothetical protein